MSTKTGGNAGCLIIGVLVLSAIAGIEYAIKWHRVKSPFKSDLEEYSVSAWRASTLPADERMDSGYIRGKILALSGRNQEISALQPELPEDLRAMEPAEVGTLLLVEDGKILVGRYTDGVNAYTQTSDLTLIDKSTLKILATQHVIGSPPPFSKESSFLPETGMRTDRQVIEYLRSLPQTPLNEPEFTASRIQSFKDRYATLENKPGVLKRIVEYELAHENTAEAQRWIDTAVKDGIKVAYNTAAADFIQQTKAADQAAAAQAAAKVQADADAKRLAQAEEERKAQLQREAEERERERLAAIRRSEVEKRLEIERQAEREQQAMQNKKVAENEERLKQERIDREEKTAASKLAGAKALLRSNPAVGRERLKELVNQFGHTRSGEEAKTLLKELE